MPSNIHLITLEPWADDRLLVRLEHIVEINDDQNLKPTLVSLSNLFEPFVIVEAIEMTLNANQVKLDAEANRFQ